VWNGHRLIQLDKVGLVKAQKQIEAQHHISVGQAVRAATGDTELGYRVGLQAMALAQANRRRHVPGFTIYCSGVT
jgi:hypothetical protein